MIKSVYAEYNNENIQIERTALMTYLSLIQFLAVVALRVNLILRPSFLFVSD